MDLKPLFKPKTMAVIGLSLTNEKHPANVIFNKNNLRHRVDVFAVNEKGGIHQGETVYRSISEIPRKIDLAVIATRAETVPDMVADCIRAGAGGAVVISGGFAEIGKKDLQDSLAALARKSNFPFIGPNCVGIYCPPAVDTIFIPPERIVKPEPGNVALVSQSGGILVDHLIRFWDQGVGVSMGVSIGNKALIREMDLLEYFASDPDTGVIAFYMEGFGENEGRGFVEAAARCHKPVIVLKSGKTAGGSRAVSSHTAVLAGDYEVFSSVLAQYGVVEARNESELVSACEALSCYPKGIDGRIAIVTGSGGHGAQAMDACLSRGLLAPTFSDSLREELGKEVSEKIRSIACLDNPVDLTGSSVDDDFARVARFLSRREEVDCILLLMLPYIPGLTSDLGARLSMIYRQEGKPMIAYVPHVEKYNMLIEGFQLNGLPVARSIEESVEMADSMRRFKRW
ncbi:MAG TPA: CoA-binding protein [Thermodesulfobacteriota bacterium]|nr:CoA-binding protein [Thermodesulfobacteriota bacterium]